MRRTVEKERKPGLTGLVILTAAALLLAGCAQAGASAGNNGKTETNAAESTMSGETAMAGGSDMAKEETTGMAEMTPAFDFDWKTYDRDGESDEELRARIGDRAFEITQNADTEAPFTGQYDHFFEKGIYVDVVSGEPLFSSLDKYDSGCGWPAFTQPISDDVIVENEDNSFGMTRVEVRSSGANSHLGHVFTDGPKATGGLRYCINSASIRFIPYDELEAQGYGEYKALFDEN